MLRRGGYRGVRVSALIAALVLVAAGVEAGGIRPGGNAVPAGGGLWQQLLAWVQAWSLEGGLASSLGKHGSSIDPNGGPGGSGSTVTVGTTPQAELSPDSLGEIR
jgi:hypothetical protein